MNSKINSSENPKRLQEIYSVLKKHEIVKGLTPEKLRLILEDFGPTFVKLGQIMSMRTDILPASYCAELEKLRADVNPMSFEDVKNVIESEFGQPAEEIFKSIDETPLGSASIAQVHAATLQDGRKIVVKVQRPGIRDTMAKDFAFLRKASVALKLTKVGELMDFNMILDEMWNVSQQELDFLVEAGNAEEFYELNASEKRVTCPVIEKNMTTSKVLVMEYAEGFQIDNFEKLDSQGYDRNDIGTVLVDNYIKQVLEDGFFHADPHPGNIRIRNDQIVWIDMGMMGRLSHKDREIIKQAVKAVVMKNTNELKSAILQLGVYTEKINQVELYADVDALLEKYSTLELGDLNMGTLLEEVSSVAMAHHISLPKGVSMLGRGMITIEGVISKVSPDVNVIKVASARIFREMREDFDLKKEIVTNARKIKLSGEKAVDIPSLAADLLNNTLKGQTKVNLDVTGSKEPLSQLETMVTRLVASIITASLLLASSVICTTNMSPQLMDIPALGFFGYVAALILSIWLIVTSRSGKKK